MARTDAAGVANSRKKAQTHARKLAAQLQRSLATSARVLVAVQNRGEEDLDQYWLGWATRVQQPHESEGTVPGTRTRYDAVLRVLHVPSYPRTISILGSLSGS